MQAPQESRGRRGRAVGGPPPNGGTMRGRAARRQGPLGRLGTLNGAAGIGIVAASALLGAIITIVQRQDPGSVLGVLLVLGTILAGLAVRTRSARLIIPAPVFCYVPAAVIAGAINDRSVDTSKIGLIIHGGKWISSGFTAMTFATIVAIVLTGVRLFLDYRAGPRRPRSRAGSRSQAPGNGRHRPAPDDDLDGRTRPIGRVGPAPTGPIGGPANGPGNGAWRQPPGTGGYPQPQAAPTYPPGPASGGRSRQQGPTGPYPQPPRPGPGPGPGSGQQGSGPYQQPPAGPGSGGYPPQRG